MFYSKPKLIIDHGLTSLTMTDHSERSRRVTDDKSFRIAIQAFAPWREIKKNYFELRGNPFQNV